MFSMALAAIADIHRTSTVNFNAEAKALGPYKGRGKGRAASHDQGGTRAFQRAATKARNVKRHKAHCKGAR